MKEAIRIVPLKSWLSNVELELFFGKGNIIEIRRTSKVSEVEIYSEQPVEVLSDLLREREDIYHLENRLLTDKRWGDQYRKVEKQLSSNAPCERITQRVNGVIEHGFSYVHDDGTWQQVWQLG